MRLSMTYKLIRIKHFVIHGQKQTLYSLVISLSVRNEVVPVIYIVVFTKERVGWGRVNLLCGHDLRTCDYIKPLLFSTVRSDQTPTGCQTCFCRQFKVRR